MVLGCVFLVDNALLIEDFSRRKGNPTNNQQPITHNPKPDISGICPYPYAKLRRIIEMSKGRQQKSEPPLGETHSVDLIMLVVCLISADSRNHPISIQDSA